MAVLQREFNWSTYQDKQLKVLEQIEKHISRSVESSKLITDNMTKLSNSIERMVKSTNSLADTIAILQGASAESVRVAREYRNSLEQNNEALENLRNKQQEVTDQYESQRKALEEADKAQRTSADIVRDNLDITNDALEGLIKFREDAMSTIGDQRDLARAIEESVNDISKNSKNMSEAVDTVINKAIDKLADLDQADENYEKQAVKILAEARGTVDGIFEREKEISDMRRDALNELISTFKRIALEMAAMADKYSEASNHMIYLSGTSGEDIKKFRGDIVKLVEGLNDTTGNFYSAEKAYSQVVAMSQGVTSDLDTIKEMAPSLLLAQETLNMNTGTLADMFSKYYNKYNFNSMQMEEVLNGIRNNTAGNAANAQTTAENIKSLEHIVEFNSKGDKEELAKNLDQISKYTSWMESMHIDSKSYTQYMKDIAYGDFEKNTALVGMLNRGGLDTMSAQELVKSGDLGKVQQALMDGLVKTMDKVGVENTVALGKVLDNLGLDRNTAMETYNVAKYGKNYQSYDQFVEDHEKKKATTMRKAVDDKYVSFLDKIYNKLSEWAVKFADWQESMGVGIKEIIGAIGGLVATWKSLDIIKSMLGMGGGVLPPGTIPSAGGMLSGAWNTIKGAGSSAWTAVKGVGTKLAPVASKATAGLAGGYMVYDGAVDALDDKKSTVSRSLSAIEAGAGVAALGSMAAGAGLLGSGALATALAPILLPALAVGGVAYGGKKLYDYLQEPEDVKDSKKHTPDAKVSNLDIDGLNKTLKNLDGLELSDDDISGLKAFTPDNSEIETLRKEVAQYKELVENKQQEKDETPSLMLEEIQQIRSFLETWKSDNDKKTILSDSKDKYQLQTLFLRGYLNPQRT